MRGTDPLCEIGMAALAAALRLKNGSCEDDEPSQVFRIAPPRERGEHGRPDRERHSRGSLIDDRRQALQLKLGTPR